MNANLETSPIKLAVTDIEVCLQTIQPYHMYHNDAFGVTRFGVVGCAPLISYYDEDNEFRLMEETDDGVITPDPDDVQRLYEAIEQAISSRPVSLSAEG
jgi:hypothetical protein